MKPELRFEQRSGLDIATVFPQLARLRIAVFRDFPYLYEGTEEYELHYLQTYAEAPNALLFSVYDGDEMVGATTCIPLLDETAEVQKPFIEAGYDLSKIFYFGESVLLPGYRGLGLGHRFFDAREAHARSFGQYNLLCFCAVQRPDDHPLKPEGYLPLDGFWHKRGYQKEPRLQSFFEWPDIGETNSTAKPMVYWTRQLT